MTLFFLIGVGGFVLFMFFEILTIKGVKKYLILVPSVTLFLFGTLMVFIKGGRDFLIPNPLRFFLYIVLFVSIVLLFYSLFLNIPFKRVYVENGFKQKLVRTGLYSISRHPGFLFLSLFFISLSLLRGSFIFLLYSLIIILFDFILIYYQDKVIFPEIFRDYNEYKKEVNFILGRRKRK